MKGLNSKINKYKKEPIRYGEENSGIRSFNVQNVVVIKEAFEEFVNNQTTDDRRPHLVDSEMKCKNGFCVRFLQPTKPKSVC